ncbi:MAG TPA: glutaredoxin [Bacteroidetes bacterium]|nr:glutaredoxin [Bacteroidota bacterium]
MAILKEQDRQEVEKMFADLPNPVKLLMFTQSLECQYCSETRELLEEVAATSDKISLEVLNFVNDKDIAEKYGIDKIPATVIMNEKDYGIRLFGIPSGYEFSTLLETIKMVSAGDSGLPDSVKKELAAISEKVHLQVFITPTCPYCPQAVINAFKFAMENDNITADMVEAIEFPHLSQKYGVMGVPKTVANEQGAAEGAVPETHLLERIKSILAS